MGINDRARDIRILPCPKEVTAKEITALLHRAHARNVAQGLHFAAATQTEETTASVMRDARTFVALADGELAGVVVTKRHVSDGTGAPGAYTSIHMLAVDPKYSGGGARDGLGRKLLDRAQSAFADSEALELDTASTAHLLVRYYEKIGFVKTGSIQWPNTNYLSVVLRRTNARKEEFERMKPIAFYIANLPQYLSCKAFIRALSRADIPCELIVPTSGRFEPGGDGWDELMFSIYLSLKRKGYTVRTKAEALNERYQVVCAPCYDEVVERGEYKIRYRYSVVTKPSWSYAAKNTLPFDCVLCYGRRDEDVFKAFTNTCIVGEPRILDMGAKRTIDDARKTILYAPTYESGLDFAQISDGLKQLGKKYRLQIKLHPGTDYLKEEDQIKRMLSSCCDETYDGDEDLMRLLQEADLLLSDYSGSIFNAMAVGVPVAVLRVGEDPAYLASIKGSELEMLVEDGTIPCIGDIADLPRKLDAAFDDAYLAKQKAASAELFSCEPQEGVERFCELVRTVLDGGQPEENTGAAGKWIRTGAVRMFGDLSAECARYREEASAARQQLAGKNDELAAYEHLYDTRIDGYEKKLAQVQEEYEAYRSSCDEKLQQTEQTLTDLNDRMAQIRLQSRRALEAGRMLSTIRSFKMTHLIGRFRYQFLKGTKEEKREFRRWVGKKLRGEPVDCDTVYNPIYRLLSPLESIEKLTRTDQTAVNALPGQDKPARRISRDLPFLREEYRKYDVLVFAVIDYRFRYQRPQQIADHFVRNGHRVFYINANFSGTDGFQIERQGGLRMVTLSNSANSAVYTLDMPEDCAQIGEQLDRLVTEQGIRDAVMIADYPTWVSGIRRLKKKYGFSLVTDYMDDFTGFLTTCEPFVKDDCIQLLRMSDAVVASSQFLLDVARQHNERVFPIRNGTEFDHFHKVFGRTGERARKVIGYYGAIAEWFDAGKIEYLAKRFSDCDIVLIGNVTNERVKAFKQPNIKLMGEIPYRELPEKLADFDVCLIPFDTTTDLIKATNPVKFYEYLSAGKKIVATEIPELEPYRDKYVYLANDDGAFGDAVEKCLNGTDDLAPPEACAAFARENDWSERVEAFEKVVDRTFPRVSVIVLCYNQLEYTRRCVDSVLANTAYPNYELILVDNDSTDDTAAYLRELADREPRVKIVLNKTNRGFAGGNNDGIDVAEGEYIVLLNNDTLVTRGWLTGMVKHCVRDARAGIVGAVTNSIGNEAQIVVDYDDAADMPAFAYAYTAEHMNETYPLSGVLAMFCVMFPRRLIDRIGKLDENYGVGMFEDDDYSVAARRAGFELVLPEDVFVHHFGNVSFSKLQDKTYRELFEKNKAYFESKWKTKWKMHHYRQ